MTNALVLVGMPGSGKSFTGRNLADKTGLTFYDSDSVVEDMAGQKIAEIFRTHGEAHFRKLEERAIQELLNKGPVIIATGGGAVISERTRAALAGSALTVWLRADPEILLARVGNDATRPLLQTADPLRTLKEMLAAREGFYARADIIHDVSSADEEENLNRLIDSLCEYLGTRKV